MPLVYTKPNCRVSAITDRYLVQNYQKRLKAQSLFPFTVAGLISFKERTHTDIRLSLDVILWRLDKPETNFRLWVVPRLSSLTEHSKLNLTAPQTISGQWKRMIGFVVIELSSKWCVLSVWSHIWRNLRHRAALKKPVFTPVEVRESWESLRSLEQTWKILHSQFLTDR